MVSIIIYFFALRAESHRFREAASWPWRSEVSTPNMQDSRATARALVVAIPGLSHVAPSLAYARTNPADFRDVIMWDST
jgi:hypothetical protein